ncbi:probable elongator complex protein 2 [Ischnura elegans]|uniref:probable elongator complex protein 2 n=1 Tax=Ischnura elegans TaxID=197161 RepID=UPI001ED88B14|nr:probable elongator complex protein 2 [Ischnura elegans]
MAVETIYTSCACNSSRHSTDWGINNLICFGSCNCIAIYDPEKSDTASITHTLCNHSKPVNSVRWIRTANDAKEIEFVSSSCDCSAALWRRNDDGHYQVICSMKGHESDVIIADGLRFLDSDSHSSVVIATASLDSTLKIWHVGESDDIVSSQTLDLKSEMCFEVRVCCLPKTSIPLIICANTDCKIYFYVQISGEYVKVNVLEGHEDFVRSIDVTVLDAGELLIASGDQGGVIRVWRLSPQEVLREIGKDDDHCGDYKPEEISFCVNGLNFSIAIESVILAHDGMINGLQWHPKVDSDGGLHQPLKLLSCSMDKSMVLWEPEPQSGVWLESVRVGEIGGNSMGFFGCKYGPEGTSILAYSKQGSFHMWNLNKDTANWEPRVTVGGHFNAVVDIHWEPQGEFLLSVSCDQTTRLHAPWKREDGKESWHEIARPQIHGHDMSCIAVLSRYKFASGSEEKVGRVFEAPKNFIENFHRICKVEEENSEIITAPQGASIPSLGLSNKAVYEGHTEKSSGKNEYPEPYFMPVDLYEPPTEEHLMQNTLWPEVQKLYGHGYEIFCMAASHDGSILASACKSTSPQHASIILWDAKTWKLLHKLESHSLTVTQMAFSPDDQFLLSVSRDRRWSIFERNEKGSGDACTNYQLAATSPKVQSSHSRIIWSCSWSHDSKYFVTCSREGKAIVWGMSCDNEWQNPKMWPLKLPESVTAAAFACQPLFEGDIKAYLITLGTEGGLIYVYSWQPTAGNETEKSWKHLNTLNNESAHHKTVRRLAFRPTNKNHTEGEFQFASCGDDNLVKIYNLTLKM